MKGQVYVHPDQPMPAPVIRLWHVLDMIQLPYVKVYWVGGRQNRNYGYYLPAVVSYRPGIQHRLAVDFLGVFGHWVVGNRKRSLRCSEMGMEYLALQRDLPQADMMTQLRSVLSRLRGE